MHLHLLLLLLSVAASGHWGANHLALGRELGHNPRQQDNEDGERFWNELPKTCGRFNLNAERISSGWPTKVGQYPSFVKVHMPKTFCGGVLISSSHVLTAAHCVKGQHEVVINVHTHHPEWGTGRHKAAKICLPANYSDNPTFGMDGKPIQLNDVAIIKLAESIDFDKIVQPACLPTRDMPYECKVVAVGLGPYYDDMADMEWPTRKPTTGKPDGELRRLSDDDEDEGCEEEEEDAAGGGGLKSERTRLLPKMPLALEMKRTRCGPANRDKSILCLESAVRGLGTACRGDSGSPAYGLESGRHTVSAIMSYTNSTCMQGLAGDGYLAAANVYNMRYVIKGLLRACA